MMVPIRIITQLHIASLENAFHLFRFFVVANSDDRNALIDILLVIEIFITFGVTSPLVLLVRRKENLV